MKVTNRKIDTHAILYKASMLSLFVVMAFMVYILYLNVTNSAGFKINAPIKIISKDYVNESLQFNFNYCKGSKIAHVEYKLINGQVITLSQNDLITSSGCEDASLDLHVPKSVPNGEYFLQVNVEYERSIFKKEHYIFTSPKFIIKK